MKKYELLKKRLNKLLIEEQTKIPSSYKTIPEEEAVKGRIVAYTKSIKAIKEIQEGQSVDEVIRDMNNTLIHYKGLEYLNDIASNNNPSNYGFEAAVVYYMAAHRILLRYRDLILLYQDEYQ